MDFFPLDEQLSFLSYLVQFFLHVPDVIFLFGEIVQVEVVTRT